MPADPIPAELAPPRRRAWLPIFAAFAQGLFCLALGLWPLVNWPSFEALAGANANYAQIVSTALLLAAVGLSLVISAIRRDIAIEVFVLGIATGLARAGAGIAAFLHGHRFGISLIEAVPELLFVALWAFALRDVRRRRRPISLDPPIFGNATGDHHASG